MLNAIHWFDSTIIFKYITAFTEETVNKKVKKDYSNENRMKTAIENNGNYMQRKRKFHLKNKKKHINRIVIILYPFFIWPFFYEI